MSEPLTIHDIAGGRRQQELLSEAVGRMFGFHGDYEFADLRGRLDELAAEVKRVGNRYEPGLRQSAPRGQGSGGRQSRRSYPSALVTSTLARIEAARTEGDGA